MSRSARPAATVCVFRDGVDGVEVLMVRRGETARFMGGAWVFPGGTVDEFDAGPAADEAVTGDVDAEMRPWIAAALRELVEEVQVWVTAEPVVLDEAEAFEKNEAVYHVAAATGRRLDLSRAAYFANWVTPSMVPIRFDTRFFAVAVSPTVRPFPDPAELASAEWVRPETALERATSGSWDVPFPTHKTLERLTGFADAAAVMEHMRSIGAVPAVQPRMRVSDAGNIEVVLPGEPGFDLLEDVPPDPETLRRAAQAAARSDGSVPPELRGAE